MKRNIFSLLLLTLFCFSCNETMPEIPCVTCDNSGEEVLPEDRKVLVEEFTGVRCVQCPAGSAELENLLDVHGERLIVVSIHAGGFATPYNDGNDFRTDEGEALNSFLDLPEGYPTATINRKLFENEPDLQLIRTSWGGYIAAEKEELSNIVLDLSLNYDAATRSLTANTTIKPVEDITESTRLSVMVLESGIIGHQIVPGSFDEEYVHKHVLRTMLTPFNGESIDEALNVGATIEKQHSMTLPDEWNSDKVKVIVFVHKEGASREVIQAEEAALAE